MQHVYTNLLSHIKFQTVMMIYVNLSLDLQNDEGSLLKKSVMLGF